MGSYCCYASSGPGVQARLGRPRNRSTFAAGLHDIVHHAAPGRPHCKLQAVPSHLVGSRSCCQCVGILMWCISGPAFFPRKLAKGPESGLGESVPMFPTKRAPTMDLVSILGRSGVDSEPVPGRSAGQVWLTSAVVFHMCCVSETMGVELSLGEVRSGGSWAARRGGRS